MDGGGRVLVLDRESLELHRIDVAARKREALPVAGGWPHPGFLPDDTSAFGDTLLVAGRTAPEARTWTLVALAPGAEGTYTARNLGELMSAGSHFAFTPSGTLVVVDGLTGNLRMLTNAMAAPKAAPEEKEEAPGQPSRKAEKCRRQRARNKAGAATGPDLGALAADRGAAGEAKGRDRLVPCDEASRGAIARKVAEFASGAEFPEAFKAWAVRAEQAWAFPGDGTLFRLAPWGTPGIRPKGVGPFHLGEAVLERAVQWMLRNAADANPAAEVAAWEAGNRLRRPRFSFGMYRQPGYRNRVVLEVWNLQDRAGAMDLAAGGGSLPTVVALAAQDGATGIRPGAPGEYTVHGGLQVILDQDIEGIAAIRAGGLLLSGPVEEAP